MEKTFICIYSIIDIKTVSSFYKFFCWFQCKEIRIDIQIFMYKINFSFNANEISIDIFYSSSLLISWLFSFDRYPLNTIPNDDISHKSSTLRQEAISLTKVRCKQRQTWFNSSKPIYTLIFYLLDPILHEMKRRKRNIKVHRYYHFSRWNKCSYFFFFFAYKCKYELNKSYNVITQEEEFSRVCTRFLFVFLYNYA